MKHEHVVSDNTVRGVACEMFFFCLSSRVKVQEAFADDLPRSLPVNCTWVIECVVTWAGWGEGSIEINVLSVVA